jgi:flagellin-like hook-associated protein FlgL
MASIEASIARVQQSISSGLRNDAVSQDITAVTKASGLQEVIEQAGVHNANLDELDMIYAESDQSLSVVHDALSSISELLGRSRNGALSASDRNALGVAIGGHVDQVFAELARNDSQGRPLYSGGVADVDHPTLLVRPGLTMGTAIPLTQDLQDRMTALRSAAWASGPGLSGGIDADRAAALAEVADLQSAALAARQSVGGRWELVLGLQEANQAVADNARTARSKLVDTDIAEAAADLATYTAQLQAARAMFSRIQSTSLFDVIR